MATLRTTFLRKHRLDVPASVEREDDGLLARPAAPGCAFSRREFSERDGRLVGSILRREDQILDGDSRLLVLVPFLSIVLVAFVVIVFVVFLRFRLIRRFVPVFGFFRLFHRRRQASPSASSLAARSPAAAAFRSPPSTTSDPRNAADALHARAAAISALCPRTPLERRRPRATQPADNKTDTYEVRRPR